MVDQNLAAGGQSRRALASVTLMLFAVALLGSNAIGASAEKIKRSRIGPVYAIAEPDMLDEIERKLKAMQKDGTLQRMEQEAVARGLASAKRPQGVGLKRATVDRQWVHDPTYIVPQDIADHQGRVFAFAGDRINPLERGAALRNPLLFVDMDDGLQAGSAAQLLAQYPNAKVILVAGDWTESAKSLGKPVFFDQRGTLVQTFGITAVPAVVTQQENMLLVKEIALDPNRVHPYRTSAPQRP